MKIILLSFDLAAFIEDNLTQLILLLILFLLSVVITRAIFSIPTFLKHQKAQTITLLKIAEDKGVDEDTIEKILNVVEKKGENGQPKENGFRQLYNRL